MIGLLVLEKKAFKGVYHSWVWRPSWSCDLDQLFKLTSSFPEKLHKDHGFDWPRGFRGEDIFEIENGMTDDRWTPGHGYAISSPCELR